MGAVRQDHGGGAVGVAVFNPLSRQVFFQRRVARRGDEQGVPTGQHIVSEPWRGDLIAANAAARPVVALQNQDFFPVFA